ncbi:cytochrome P450 [Pseudobdellovibrio sp. HCB154]|uniref:cytochrome P450 n=1 Tax=Pseudobdellovibrio sp. HCB154 TaxID=3386277 RepID=UPI00391766A4
MSTGCPVTALFKNNPIGRLLEFQKDPFAFFDKHKPENAAIPVELNLGFRRFFFCYHPDHAQHILQDQKHKYNKSSLVLNKIKALSGPQGLIQLVGEDAARVRNTSAKLMSTDGMDRLIQKVDKFVEEIFPIIDKAIENNEAVDLVPHLTKIVLRTAGVFVLNHDLISESEKLNSAFVDLNRKAGESLRSIAECPFFSSKQKSLNTIHTELDRIAEEVLKDEEPSLLKAMTLRNEEKPFIRDQLKAFMFAGYDTTASSLIFATYLVAASASAQQSIALEAEKKLQQNYDSLRKSTFVQSTYKEALRLYPSAYFLPRETNQDDILGGVKIPKGSQVFLSVRHLQRHPDYFENPNEFKADRFLEDLKHQFSFIPFGGGPRICIGAALAKLEATLVLQKLCERYEMQTVYNRPPTIEALITAHTNEPLPVIFKRRDRYVS